MAPTERRAQVDDVPMPAGLSGEGAERFRRAVAAIDAANADDPNTVTVDGVTGPKELTHARMVCDWVVRLDPGADEAQLLAARAHHLRRWELPRSAYPEGRAGYLRWRTEQKRRHAEITARLLREAGYDDATIGRVGAIIRKERLRTDPAVQTHEDALCLVFLQTQLADVAAELGPERTVEVLVKTLRKMSPAGIAAAAALPLPGDLRALLGEAVSRTAADPDTPGRGDGGDDGTVGGSG